MKDTDRAVSFLEKLCYLCNKRNKDNTFCIFSKLRELFRELFGRV